jgi:hypothetical protein
MSYDYLDFQGFSTLFRISAKFLPHVAEQLPDQYDRMKCHLSFDYRVSYRV